jgi:hypothetical protein
MIGPSGRHLEIELQSVLRSPHVLTEHLFVAETHPDVAHFNNVLRRDRRNVGLE